MRRNAGRVDASPPSLDDPCRVGAAVWLVNCAIRLDGEAVHRYDQHLEGGDVLVLGEFVFRSNRSARQR